MITVILGIVTIYFAVGFLLAAMITISASLNFSMEELYGMYKNKTGDGVEYSTFKYLFYPLTIFIVTLIYPVLVFDVYKKRAKNAKNAR